MKRFTAYCGEVTRSQYKSKLAAPSMQRRMHKREKAETKPRTLRKCALMRCAPNCDGVVSGFEFSIGLAGFTPDAYPRMHRKLRCGAVATPLS